MSAKPPEYSDTDNVRWHPATDVAALQRHACCRIMEAAADAIAMRGRFILVLAGGSTPRAIYEALRDADTDWARWDIWFGDERCLPKNDSERNSTMAADAWLAHVPIPPANIHFIAAGDDAIAAASRYAQALHDVGTFDLVLLGLGEDGHTASLFPGHDWGCAADAAAALAVLNAPKPPPRRVSMSASRLSNAHQVLFLVAGESKAEAVQRWRRRDAIPARAIRPEAGVDVLLTSDLLGFD